MADELKQYIAGKAVGTPIWPGTWHDRGADMIRSDAGHAGLTLDVQTPTGVHVLDFHSLRGTLGVMLEAANIPLKTRQTILRHSDPRLTLNRYTNLTAEATTEAMNALPSVFADTIPLTRPLTRVPCKRLEPSRTIEDGTEGEPGTEAGIEEDPKSLEMKGIESDLEPSETIENGEGGIRPRQNPHSAVTNQLAAFRLARPAIPFLSVMLVICQCFVTMGIVFSSNPAHVPPAIVTLSKCLSSRCRASAARSRRIAERGILAASYSRYSSDQQDASSIAQQQHKCRKMAVFNSHDLRPQFEYADEPISGTRIDRVGFQRMLAAARNSEFQILYVENLSRLARELVISLPVLKELVYVHHIRIISTSEGLDSDRAGWEMMAIFRSYMHGEYLTVLRSAVLRGQEDAITNDYSVGDWCLGYGSEPIPGSDSGRRGRNKKPRMKVVINDEHAKWVRTIFRMYVEERRSLSWIAKELTRVRAPKDHRSSKPGWRTNYVVGVLTNRKYIGIWPWGQRTNVRNPLTGQIRQEWRPEEEVFERERPELRIINDELFFRAEALLEESRQRMASVLQQSGRLQGSTRDMQNPRHLLQGLIRCEACGSGFRITGTNGLYLRCAGYDTGICSCRTQLPRKRAERLILEKVGQLVLEDPVWRNEVHHLAQEFWTERQQNLPDEEREAERELAVVEQRIAHLVDAVEQGSSTTDFKERLAMRQREREEIHRRLAALRQRTKPNQSPPTADWIDGELRVLTEVLRSGTPAAAVALRNLIGQIIVTEMNPAVGKRKYFRGEFEIVRGEILNKLDLPNCAVESGTSDRMVIDFVEPPAWSGLVESVKEMYDAGLTFDQMAVKLNCPKSWARKALRKWYRDNDLTPPDHRKERGRQESKSLIPELANSAIELWNEGMLMGEIAERLECCRDMVTAAIRHWHMSRGLPVPDGRTRRKTLIRKTSNRSESKPENDWNDGSLIAADTDDRLDPVEGSST